MNKIPRKLYKYVDIDDAHYLERGSIRIGTLIGYENLENDRTDNHEGFISVEPTAVHLSKDVDSDERQGLRRLGLKGSGEINIHAAPGAFRIRTARANAHCFCLSSQPNSMSLLSAPKEQAIFQIDDLRGFCNRLRDTVTAAIPTDLALGQVTYTDYNLASLGKVTAPLNPLLTKRRYAASGYSFEGENEWRLLWLNDLTDMAGDDQIPLVPFNTPPDPILARFMRRIM